MMELQTLFDLSAQRHRDHLCPRQVLGVRMGVYAAELFDLKLPQNDKRLFAFVETDGCVVDGIAAATGCAPGSRTMRIMDYGKTAATFVDTSSNRAIRILPGPDSRKRAYDYAPDAPDRWHAQLAAYQVMPAEELLVAQAANLSISLTAIISRHGLRAVCDNCGEDIINEREVHRADRVLCRSCAGDSYYALVEDSALKTRTPVRKPAAVRVFANELARA
jgi:formylmethanofuran dehydrogenase subunit E